MSVMRKSMKLSVFVLGLFLVTLGIALMLSSNISYQKRDSSWEIVKSEVDATQISSNFTKEEKAKLLVFPTSQWLGFLEPQIDDVPYPHNFVYIYIRDPYGNTSEYEIAFVKPPGSSSLSIYKITLINSNESGSQNGVLLKEIVWEVMYSGEYVAEVWGVFPAGDPPGSLTFMKEKVIITTEYPYAGYFYHAVAVFVVGVVLSIWSAKTPRRQVRIKTRTHTKRR